MIYLPWIAFGLAVWWMIREGDKAKKEYLRLETEEQKRQEMKFHGAKSPVAAVIAERLSPQSPVGLMKDWGSKQQGQEGPYHN
jgi:hypothetical protein